MKITTKSFSLVILLALVAYIPVAFSYAIFPLARPFSTIFGLLWLSLISFPRVMRIVGLIWLFVKFRKERFRAALPLFVALISWGIVFSLNSFIVNAHLGLRLNFNLYQEFASKAESGEIVATKEIGDYLPKPYAIVPEKYTSLTNRSEIILYQEDTLTIIIFPRHIDLLKGEAYIFQSAGISPSSRTPQADPKNVMGVWEHCQPTFHRQWFVCYLP